MKIKKRKASKLEKILAILKEIRVIMEVLTLILVRFF
jgi:hypothetical protein